MFGKKRWRNDVLVEGEKGARMVQRIEKIPGEVNPEFDDYPVDVKIPGRRSLKEAIKKSIEYSKGGIYNMFYRVY